MLPKTGFLVSDPSIETTLFKFYIRIQVLPTYALQQLYLLRVTSFLIFFSFAVQFEPQIDYEKVSRRT